MPRWTKTVQANFSKGELMPEAWGRIDSPIYAAGARHLLNAALLPQGGFRQRPGTVLFDQETVAGVRMAGMFYSPTELYLFIIEPGALKIFNATTLSLISTFIGLPWTIDNMGLLNSINVEGLLVIAHEAFWPVRIMRHDVNVFGWDYYPFEWNPDGSQHFIPYYKFAPASMTITPSGLGPGSLTLTTNAPYWSSRHDDVSAYGAHCHIELTYPADPVANTPTQRFTFIITNVVDNLHATCTLLGTKALPNLQAQVNWAEQVCNPVWGYPRVCGYHDQRFLFAGHPHAPGLFCASQTGAPYNYDTGTGLDDEAIVAVIATESSNQIRGLLSGHHLIVMTSQGPFYYPGSDTSPLTPSTITFRRTAAQQCAWTPPAFYDQAAMYVQRRGGHIREMMYDLYKQAYTAEATSLVSGHLVKNPVDLEPIEPDNAGNPNRYLAALNEDGTLAVYLGERAQEISGWVPWVTRGGTIQAIASVGEFFFLAVQRTRQGVSKINIERLDWTQLLDSARTYTSVNAITAWSGLTAFSGMTVDIIGDGYYMGRYPVDSTGHLTLPGNFACKTLVVGIAYDTLWETMAVDQPASGAGPRQGRPYSLASCVVRVKDTESLRVNGTRLWPRRPKDPTGQPPPLQQGHKEVFLRDWGASRTIILQQDYPCPVMVSYIDVELSD